MPFNANKIENLVTISDRPYDFASCNVLGCSNRMRSAYVNENLTFEDAMMGNDTRMRLHKKSMICFDPTSRPEWLLKSGLPPFYTKGKLYEENEGRKISIKL